MTLQHRQSTAVDCNDASACQNENHCSKPELMSEYIQAATRSCYFLAHHCRKSHLHGSGHGCYDAGDVCLVLLHARLPLVCAQPGKGLQSFADLRSATISAGSSWRAEHAAAAVQQTAYSFTQLQPHFSTAGPELELKPLRSSRLASCTVLSEPFGGQPPSRSGCCTLDPPSIHSTTLHFIVPPEPPRPIRGAFPAWQHLPGPAAEP